MGLVDILDRLVDKRAEHRRRLPMRRKAEILVGHVLQGTVLVEKDVRRESIGILERRRLHRRQMQFPVGEGATRPVRQIGYMGIERLAEIVLSACRFRPRQHKKVLRTRERHIVLAPEVEELRPLDWLEDGTIEILRLQQCIQRRPALARRPVE